MIVSLYAGGMRTRDIKAHLTEVYGVEISQETVAKLTEVVIEEVRAWQSQPVDEGRFLRSCSLTASGSRFATSLVFLEHTHLRSRDSPN